MNKTSSKSEILVTDRASKKIQDLIFEDGKENLMLRLEVSGGGCSGFSYGFSLDTSVLDGDVVFSSKGIKIVIDNISLELVSGSEIDYAEDLMASSFRLNNPKATSTCGCGTSFSI